MNLMDLYIARRLGGGGSSGESGSVKGGLFEMHTAKHTVVYPKSYALPSCDYAFGSGSFTLNHTEVTTNDVE